MIVPGNKYLLSVLNPSVGDWYIRQLGVTHNGGYFEYKPMFVEQLPLPIIDNDAQQPYVELVGKIHAVKHQGGYIKSIETQLDQMLFNLYGLNKEEIDFITSKPFLNSHVSILF